jgi:hypothetical protein
LAFTGIKSVTFGLLENDFDDDMGHEIYGGLSQAIRGKDQILASTCHVQSHTLDLQTAHTKRN